ncbi:uncharacterized protein METZ01_LOCUS184646, partial [marine metagenome]
MVYPVTVFLDPSGCEASALASSGWAEEG